MKRNSTIIGLSDAMILVESGVSGGTFAAGNETLKLNRPLFVIDFAHPGPSAEANKHFIEKGGVPIRGDRNRRPNLDKLFAKITEKYNIPSANLIQTEKVCAHNSTTIQRLLF